MSSYDSARSGATYLCPQCNGEGIVDDTNGNKVTCPTCHGNGQVTNSVSANYRQKVATPPPSAQPAATSLSDDPQVATITCPECGGAKEITRDSDGKMVPCPVCSGFGVVTERDKTVWDEHGAAAWENKR